jgi:hypothetical protein
MVNIRRCFFATSGCTEPGKKPSASPQAIGKEASWIAALSALERIRDKCSSLRAPASVECFVTGMKDEGASTQAVAFAKLMRNSAFMNKFLETGSIEVAYVEHPFQANENYSWFLVNGTPDLIDVDDPVYRANSGFERDDRYTSLLKAYPQLLLWPDDRTEKSTPMVRCLKGQGKRFVISYRITDGCRECNYLGTALFAFDFDRDGSFTGTKIPGY